MYHGTLSNLHKYVDYFKNVNFDKMLKMFIFQQCMHSIYIEYTSHKQIIKSGGSFSEHYF